MGIISSSYFAYGGSESTQTSDSPAEQSTQRRRPTPKNCLPLLGNGRFEVGCADIMVPEAGSDCGVFARIFYPTEKISTADFLPWKPEAEYVDGLAQYREMSPRKMNFFLDWILGDKRIPVQWHPPLAEGDEKFPVAIFSHGISGNRFFYSNFCASLSSHGFVVAAVEHRDGSACYTFEMERDSGGNLAKKLIEMKKLPHGEEEYQHRIIQVRKRVDETVQMLRLFEAIENGLVGVGDGREEILVGSEFDWAQFKGRLDIASAISIGHSFGGASAVTACAVEKSFNSCIILDGWLYPFEQKYYAEVTQPVLMLCASNWQWPINVKRLLHLKSQGGGIGKAMFTMTDIVHQTFSDFGLLCPGRIGRYFGLQGNIDPDITGNAIMSICVNFLQDPARSVDNLREIVTMTDNYNKFIVEGTNVPGEQLDKIDANLTATHSVEMGEEEEKRIAEGGEVDANEGNLI